MRQNNSRCITLLVGLTLTLTSIAFLINQAIYKFPGNNYFPEHVPFMVLILFLIYLGLKLLFPKNSMPIQIGQELLYFFGVMFLVALATNAVQLTPFPPIDPYIISLEENLHIHMIPILEWTNSYPQFQNILIFIYASLDYQMCFLPLFIIFTGRLHLIREYYFLLLFTTLAGFGFYYFFPTTAPASMLNSPLFSTAQIATGLKFSQIHHHINPTTNNGGLIALPSFHTIWAVLCVNLLREWLVPCIFLGLFNGLLIASCVLLGWHYCTDIAGSLLVLLISYYFLKCCRSSLN